MDDGLGGLPDNGQMRGAHPFWRWWAGVVTAHPIPVIAVGAAVSGILGLLTFLTPVDLSFMGMLDKTDPEIAAYSDAMKNFGASSMLLLLLEGDPGEIEEAVDVLAEGLPVLPDLRTVSPPTDPQWIIERSPWLWPRPIFDSVVKAVETGETPSGVEAALKTSDAFIRKSLRPSDRAALISIELEQDPLDMAMGGAAYYRVESETHRLLEEAGLSVSAQFTGITAISAQDQNSVLRRIKIMSPITFVAVLFLLFGIEPRLSRVLLAGLALVGSVAVAYGMVGIIRGQLTIGATFFGLLLLGLGVDFGIHLLMSLRDGRAHGLNPEQCVDKGIQFTGTAIALGALSTALAFGLVMLAPEVIAQEMGLAAVFGLAAALVLMLSFLPATWMLLERRPHKADTPARMHLRGLPAVVSFSLKYPRAVLAAGFLLTAFCIAGIPRYKVETDLSKIITRDMPAFEVEKRLQEIYGFAPGLYLAPVESMEQARDWRAKLQALPEMGQVSSVADLIPVDGEERAEMMKAALEKGFSDGDGGEASPAARLRTALAHGVPTLETLPANLTAGLVGKDGSLALRIVPKELVLDALTLSGRIDRIRAIAPTATGMPMMVKRLVLGQRDYTPILVPMVFVVVTIVLTAAFRNRRDVLLALLPVTMGSAFAFGIYFWLGLQFSILTGIVVPVILGLGVDDGIHVVERLRRYRIWTDENIHEAVEGVGRPIFLTTATTCISFASFLFTNHAGLESIAHFMLMGVPLCFVASITVLPAAAKLLSQTGETPRH